MGARARYDHEMADQESSSPRRANFTIYEFQQRASSRQGHHQACKLVHEVQEKEK